MNARSQDTDTAARLEARIEALRGVPPENASGPGSPAAAMRSDYWARRWPAAGR